MLSLFTPTPPQDRYRTLAFATLFCIAILAATLLPRRKIVTISILSICVITALLIAIFLH